MGLRSGDEDGHVINCSLLNPTFARYSTVERAACDGALSCMKIIFFLNAGRLLRYQGIKLSWRKFRYVSAFIFKPSGTLNGPTSSLPIIPAQNMTPPPCCRRTLDSLLQPFTSQPLHQPSGQIEDCSALIYGKNGLEVCLDIDFADFCAWRLRVGGYSVSEAWQLCWGSGNE